MCCAVNKIIQKRVNLWGTLKEKIAQKTYVRKNRSPHVNLQCQESGLFISRPCLLLGAGPDGVFSCNCYGEGILEIECPWTSRENLISEYIW